MSPSQIISSILDEEKTPIVLQLLEIIQLQSEQIQALKDEVAHLKGEKAKPKIQPSKLLEDEPEEASCQDSPKRPGSAKKKKTQSLEIHEEKFIQPTDIPVGSRFKGYQDFVVQDLVFQPFNVRYRLARWETPDGIHLVGKLPEEVAGNHFGVTLRSFILYQYNQAHVTQPLILEQLRDINIDISSGQINRILIEGKEAFHQEKEDILRVGIEVSNHLHVDDTGARHDGKNGYCTHIGNDAFAYFESTESKSRINFLKVLQGGYENYVVNADAIAYMASQKLSADIIRRLFQAPDAVLHSETDWLDHLTNLGITSVRHIRIATEGALIGGLIEHGFNPDMAIISDDAGQFNLFVHGLCWIHAERTIAKLVGFNDQQREALEEKRSQIWDFYRDLKEYKKSPTDDEKVKIEARFDEIFQEKTCFATLNQALGRLHQNKSELLLVLERPEIPLHNNLSENDIRDYVKKRKISGSTRSPTGRRCRDTFASLKKTCRKLEISFWDYLKDRLGGLEKNIPYLPELILIRSRAPQAGS